MQYQVDDAGAKVVIGDGPRARRHRRRRRGARRRAVAPRAPAVDVAARRARAAHLHERHDRQAQGRDARPRQRRRDVRHGAAPALGITAADHSLLILPLFHVNGIVVGTLSPLLAGGQRDGRRALQPEDVLRPRRAHPPDVLLGRAGDLRMLTSLPRGRDGRHLVAAARGVRRGADARGADRARRGHARRRARRGLRALGGLVRVDAQPLRRHAQARDGRPPAARAGGPRRRRRRPTRSAGRARRGRHPRRERDARLPQPARGDRRRRSSTGGCTPATSASSTRTATCGSSTASRT